jgi:hypothetical protein
MFLSLGEKFNQALASGGITVCRSTGEAFVDNLLSSLLFCETCSLLTLGGEHDGGYSIPDDLEGVVACFSPGVADSSRFELGIAELGIPVFLADASVVGPACDHPLFHFIRRYVGSFTDRDTDYIGFNEWCESCMESHEDGDLLLQMDIEGSEYEVIHSMSQNLLMRFRIISIEFHALHQLLNCNSFSFMSRAILKLLSSHRVVHVKQNPSAGYFVCNGKRFSKLLEVSFHRKDRLRP